MAHCRMKVMQGLGASDSIPNLFSPNTSGQNLPEQILDSYDANWYFILVDASVSIGNRGD